MYTFTTYQRSGEGDRTTTHRRLAHSAEFGNALWKETMNRIFCTLISTTCLILGEVNAQDKPIRNTQKTFDRLVFVPNDKSMAAKSELLAKIKSVSRDEQRPLNVVLILADDLGYADISSYGSKTIPTPHIDALAADGVRFTDAYVTAATCSPSRAGLMSGRYQQRFGFEFNTAGGAITYRESRGLDPAAVTMADVFQQAGYVTGMFGKWHLGSREYFHPQQRGFDEFFGFLAGAHSFFPVKRQEQFFSTIMRGKKPLKEPSYLTDAFAREAVEFINAHKEKPFFVYVPFNAVHTPIEASEKYLSRFSDVTNRRQRVYNAMTSALDDAVGSIVKSLKNLAERKPEVLKKLEQALQQWQNQMKPAAWPSKPNRRKVMIDGVPYELNI